MANQTPRFGLTTLDSNTDPLAIQEYRTFGAGRETIDRPLTYKAELGTRHPPTGGG